MSRRWFVSSVGVGAATEARIGGAGRPVLSPTVTMARTIENKQERHGFRGPEFALLGPGDVLGFERSLVVREEPPADTPNGVESNLAAVEFSDASLPWMFSRPSPDGRPTPWMVLLVLRAEEGLPVDGQPLPVITVPPAALPDLTDAWAWAHVEARVAEGLESPQADVVADVRSGSDKVISRLVCPRRLVPDTDWVACVVPATRAGVAAAGLAQHDSATAFDHAWTAGQGGPARLPVYHSWRFRTGAAGSFEELARLVQPIKAGELPGFGARVISTRHPWLHADLLEGAPDQLSVTVQGALRVPGAEVSEEAWSDPGTQRRFIDLLRERLDAPSVRFGAVGADPDRDEKAVTPPLYGSHFTGAQSVPGAGWQATLNLQVRHRLAASLGARYVQVEQEFLMARAWEQLGAINEANRLLVAGELCAEAAGHAQAKHLGAMDAVALTVLADPMRAQMQVNGAGTLETVLEGSAVPDGAASSAFKRLVRPGGALARRAERAAAVTAEAIPAVASVVAEGMAGGEILPESVTWVTAQADDAATPVIGDPASQGASETLVGLLEGQQPLFKQRSDLTGTGLSEQLTTLTATTAQAMGAQMVATTPPMHLRGLRRAVNAEPLVDLPSVAATVQLEVGALADSVLTNVRPLPQQLRRMNDLIASADVERRAASDARPLRRIMAHPRFGMPIAAELLSRWPEWAVPGISTFPPNSATLLETNSPFVEAMLVGLNQEFNRELLWREFPTDQRGTAFARFWPSERDNPEVDEIARWPLEVDLGGHDELGGRDLLVLLVRAEVLLRYPGAIVLAAKSLNGHLPDDGTGEWKDPEFLLPIDEQTTLYAFDLTPVRARDERWLFVLREPMRGTQFGFDTRLERPSHSLPALQEGWRWCNRCQGLNFSDFNSGICFDGNPHDFSDSGHYKVSMMEPVAGAQEGWRWCSRCQSIAFGGGGGGGVCVNGQEHVLSDSGPYSVPIDPALPGLQDGWRWCAKCLRLAFEGNGAGPCTAGGVHDHSSSGHYRVAVAGIAVPRVNTWADLAWEDVPIDARGFVVPRTVEGRPPRPAGLSGPDPGVWGADAADIARIAFQRPFQLAFSPGRLLGDPAT